MRRLGSWLVRRLAPGALCVTAVACGSTAAHPTDQASSGSAGIQAVGGNGSGGALLQAGAGGAGQAGNVNHAGSAPLSGGAGGVGGAGGPVVPMFPPLLDDCDIPAAHEHADAGLAALLVGFWSGADQYLYATSAPGSLTGYWTYAQAFDALLDGVERTGSQRYRGMIRSFYDGRELQGWLVNYFDDETWMTLALLRAYDLTGEQLYLAQAKTIYEDIMAAWDTTCCGEHLGGIWWNRAHQQKATASNAGPVIAGVRLSKRTGDGKYVAFAKQAYDFWWTHMVNQQSYAIYDHLSPNGQRAAGSLTYNHGIMIGAALELYAETGEAHFLTEAHGFGKYLVTVATRPSAVGPLLHDALGQSCDGDCPAWKGIGYRYLAELFKVDTSHTDYRDVLTAGPTGIWTLGRNADNNFFSTDWAGPAPTVGGIEEQGSAVMALNIYAMLCGSDAKPVSVAGRYEAEEGLLDHVALEAQYAGFSGFGYVSAFVATSQSVTFFVNVPKAGDYRADFSYSAAAGNAVRSVLVNDGVIAAAQTFPSTGTWDNWQVASMNLGLPEGPSTITVSYVKGGSGALNLDRLDLVAP